MFKLHFDKSVYSQKGRLIQLKFPFTAVMTYTDTRIDKKQTNFITVSITEVLLAIWNLTDRTHIERILFEFALKELRGKKEDQIFNGPIHISLDRESQSNVCQFDPQKIPNPSGYILEMGISKNKIGF